MCQLALAALIGSLIPQEVAASTIKSVVCEATLTQGGRLLVHETIDFGSEGPPRQAILRAIPNALDEQGVRHDFSVRVHGVTDGTGRRLPYSTKEHAGAAIIRIDTRGSGTPPWRCAIDYEVRGVLNELHGHAQLFFPFSSRDWPDSVERVSVILTPPPEARVNESELKAWVGSTAGSLRPATVHMDGDRIMAWAGTLQPGEGITLGVDFPGKALAGAGPFDYAEWLIEDWYPLLALPLLTVAALSLYRFTRSRRAGGGQESGEIWRPPYGMGPVELGTLIDGSCDVHDLTGILLDLSTRGFLNIREIPATGFFSLSDRDYEFTKLSEPESDRLRQYESIFLEALFGTVEKAYLSNVQGVFRQSVPQIRESIYNCLVSEGFLMKNPEKDRRRFYSLGCSLVCVGITLLFQFGEETHAKAAGMGFVVAGALIAVSLQFIPLLTDRGKAAIDRAHEFAELLRTSDSAAMAECLARDPFIFHRLLPYSMVLGVSEKWAQAFETLLSEWPEWFQFERSDQSEEPRFSARDFSRDVWIATKIAGLTFFAPPPVQYSSYALGKMAVRGASTSGQNAADK